MHLPALAYASCPAWQPCPATIVKAPGTIWDCHFQAQHNVLHAGRRHYWCVAQHDDHCCSAVACADGIHYGGGLATTWALYTCRSQAELSMDVRFVVQMGSASLTASTSVLYGCNFYQDSPAATVPYIVSMAFHCTSCTEMCIYTVGLRLPNGENRDTVFKMGRDCTPPKYEDWSV